MAHMYFAFRAVVLCPCVLFLFAVCSLPLVRTDYAPAPFIVVVCEVLSFEPFQGQICRRNLTQEYHSYSIKTMGWSRCR